MNEIEQWVLDPKQGSKPLDFGFGGTTGSVDVDGRLIALNTYHDRYGYITLTTAKPFPEAERYNPTAVRAYRRSLVDLTGFGPHFEQPIVKREAFLLGHAVPHIRLTFEDGTQAEVTTFADAEGAVQIWRSPVDVHWRGVLSLQRCAYTQLTEGGPAEMPPIQTTAVFENGALVLENPALKRAVAIAGFSSRETRIDQLTDGTVQVDLSVGEGVTILHYDFGRAHDRTKNSDAQVRLAQILDYWRQLSLPQDHLLARGIVYSLLMAVPVGETCCLLTDHMLLPLSWNRDAFYVAMALLDRVPDIVRRHLLWMFEVAERPEGIWGRCYLANGQIKDQAYQLDQQVFPLLELAEYVLATGDREIWEHLNPNTQQVLNTLMTHKHQAEWLFPTDETPADDPLVLPFHLSSHILLWRTLHRLNEVEPESRLVEMAHAVRDTIRQRFVVEGNLFAYAIDGKGRFYLYHDANDLPLALAPAWGFVSADDPIWKNTIQFAFSDGNKGGVYHGRLGSVHSPAPWALGDIQEAIIARLLKDAPREQVALTHLRQAAQWDGALPEAYSSISGDVISRHWFAWPNAALGLT